MTATKTNSDTVLELSRTFNADRARVFDAWTDAEKMRQWFPPPNLAIPTISVDAKKGGAFRVDLKDKETGTTMVIRGVYQEVVSPERLVFSWIVENAEGESPATKVTVAFKDEGDSTQVDVRHELFPDAATRDHHIQGWDNCLEQMKGLL